MDVHMGLLTELFLLDCHSIISRVLNSEESA